eukprot:scaffold2696_cov333-Pavlova_lutheri.AAC.9
MSWSAHPRMLSNEILSLGVTMETVEVDIQLDSTPVRTTAAEGVGQGPEDVDADAVSLVCMEWTHERTSPRLGSEEGWNRRPSSAEIRHAKSSRPVANRSSSRFILDGKDNTLVGEPVSHPSQNPLCRVQQVQHPFYEKDGMGWS